MNNSEFRAACTKNNFLIFKENNEKHGPLSNWPFVFPSDPSLGIKKAAEFYQCAQLLADGADDKEIDLWYDFLHMRALYDTNFVLPISNGGIISEAVFVPGCGWMDSCRVGPFRKFKYMIVGKEPSNFDFSSKRANLGISANLLGDELEDKGLSKSDFYITYVVKHQNLNLVGATLKSSWINNCNALLRSEIILTRPEVILTLGDEALKALAGRDARLSDSSGKVFTLDIPLPEGGVHSVKIVSCVSPAFVRRYPQNLERFKKSISHFSLVCNGVSIETTEKDILHFSIDSASDLLRVRDDIMKDANPVIAVDLEWQGEWPGHKSSYVRTVQISWKPKVACCIMVNKAGGGFIFKEDVASLAESLNAVFKPKDGRHVRVVGHYLTSDLPWLKSLGVDLFDSFDTLSDSGVPMDEASSKTHGGFDTLLAAHAVDETGVFNLEDQAVTYCNVPRWEHPLSDWKKEFCRDNGMKSSELGGYGMCPDDILVPYGCYDADATRRLYDYYNGVGDKNGALDSDLHGNSSRKAYWLSMRAYPAFIEMRNTGISIDKERVYSLTALYMKVYNALLFKLRAAIKWPEFNPSSPYHKRELLFGEELSGKRDSKGVAERMRPEGAISLGLDPYKSTGSGAKGKLWEEIVASEKSHLYSASTDRESLTILAETSPVACMLKDVRSLYHLCTTVLRPPECDDEGNDKTDSDGDVVYDKGLLSYIHYDGKIRSMFSQTKETGRASSSNPNMQNLGKTIEDKYKAIFLSHGDELGVSYTYPLRSVVAPSPGCVLVEADYTGAELAIMAWQSGDMNMIDHVRRANLPEDHPEYYDIHSNVAVNTFKLTCPPTKKGLKDAGKGGLRTAAKAVVFGYAYGQGAASTARRAKQEGVIISIGEAQSLIDGLVAMYPGLPIYFNECRARVTEAGWIKNSFGRYRRFAKTDDRSAISEYERQAMNFPIQSSVADAVSCALGNIKEYRANNNVEYNIILQIHDAVILEVPYRFVEDVVDNVLPICMSDKVDIRSCNLDGTPRGGNSGPFHLGIATEVFTKWSIPLTKEDCKVMGIPERFAQH